MTPTEKLQALYDSEINARIWWFWDAGFAWGLRDGLYCYSAEGDGDTLEAAIEALWTAAKERYPNTRCFK